MIEASHFILNIIYRVMNTINFANGLYGLLSYSVFLETNWTPVRSVEARILQPEGKYFLPFFPCNQKWNGTLVSQCHAMPRLDYSEPEKVNWVANIWIFIYHLPASQRTINNLSEFIAFQAEFRIFFLNIFLLMWRASSHETVTYRLSSKKWPKLCQLLCTKHRIYLSMLWP